MNIFPGIFLADESVKADALAMLKAGRASQVLHYYTWEYGHESCVSVINGSNFDEVLFKDLGVPEIVTALAKWIHFDVSEKEKALEWPAKVIEIIPVGADLSDIWFRFARWLLVDPEAGVIRFAAGASQRKFIQAIASLYEENCAEGKKWQGAGWRASEEAIKETSAKHDLGFENFREGVLCHKTSGAALSTAASAASVCHCYPHLKSFSVIAAMENYVDTCVMAASTTAAEARSAAYAKMSEKLLELLSTLPLGA